MLPSIAAGYREALLDTDGDRALAIIDQAIEMGMSPEEIVSQVVISSIETMFASVTEDSTESGSCLAQHYVAAQISSEVVEAMVLRFEKGPERGGCVVIGTAHGDFHGLGKRIVGGMLRAQMIEVVDLGLSVQAERFVEEAVVRGAEVIAISSMMVHTARGDNGCRGVRRILAGRGLEERIKIIVGGAPYRFDENLYRAVGADAWAATALGAGPVVKGLIAGVRERGEEEGQS